MANGEDLGRPTRDARHVASRCDNSGGSGDRDLAPDAERVSRLARRKQIYLELATQSPSEGIGEPLSFGRF
jgi:hypothetical protein